MSSGVFMAIQATKVSAQVASFQESFRQYNVWRNYKREEAWRWMVLGGLISLQLCQTFLSNSICCLIYLLKSKLTLQKKLYQLKLLNFYLGIPEGAIDFMIFGCTICKSLHLIFSALFPKSLFVDLIHFVPLSHCTFITTKFISERKSSQFSPIAFRDG